ncbi:MAG: murein biosynthesis integral membrane protein MurJ [Candidatus Dasytiphilus stammeri]
MNLLKSLALVSSITIFSRILGFVRDTLIARIFGAGMETDAFFVALKIPNLLRRLFAEGAFYQVFVPILSEYKNKNGNQATQLLIARISGILSLILFLVTLIGILAAPWIILVTAPGFTNSTEKFLLTSSLLRITFPYIFLISLTSMAGAILNTWNLFYVPALVPVLLNISMIISSLFAAPYFHPPILALAWSVLVGGILQLCYQLPSLKKIGMLVWPRIDLPDTILYRIFKKMVPALIGVSVNQIAMIINTILASFLVSGSVSWIYYADRIMEFPSGVLGVALGTILLPSLTKKFISSKPEEYSILMDRGLKLCLLMAVPSALALVILAKPLTVVLFQYKNFTSFDVMMTQQILRTYAVGLIGIMVVKVLSTGFYSCKNIKTPVKIAMITLLISQLVNLLYIGILKHLALSLSLSISACLNAILLYWQLRKKNIYQPQPGWREFMLKLTISVTLMAASLVIIMSLIPDWQIWTMLGRLWRMLIVILIGTSIYCMTLLLLGLRLKHFTFR